MPVCRPDREIVSVLFVYNFLGRSLRLYLSSDPLKMWTVYAPGAR